LKVSKPVLFTLIGAVVIIIYLFFFAGPKKTPPPKIVDTSGSPKTVMQVSEKAKEKGGDMLKKVSSVDASWQRDPFLLPNLPKVDEERNYVPLKLVGIIEGSDGRYAILGSNIVKKGDLIGEDRVQEIGRDRIILVRKGQRKVVSVSDAERVETFRPSLREGKR